MSDCLPNASLARVEETKLLDYLLNPGHPQGRSKAQYFIGRGFEREAWGGLADALRAQGANNRVTKTTITPWGTRFQVDCHCPTPDGSNPCIRSVWEVTADDQPPRLLTAHPLKG